MSSSCRRLSAQSDPWSKGEARDRYEVAVAVRRGQQTLLPADELVRAYLAEAAGEESPERLQEASTLLMYATGAKARGQTTLSVEELADAESVCVPASPSSSAWR